MNEHNGWVPRDFWLEDWEKQAIVGFHLKNPLEGYRRLTFMMLDADYRALAIKSDGQVQLRSRNDKDFTLRYAGRHRKSPGSDAGPDRYRWRSRGPR